MSVVSDGAVLNSTECRHESRSLWVSEHVHDVARSVANEEPAHSPHLIRQRMDDLSIALERSPVRSIDIDDLHRDTRFTAADPSRVIALNCFDMSAGSASVTIQP